MLRCEIIGFHSQSPQTGPDKIGEIGGIRRDAALVPFVDQAWDAAEASRRQVAAAGTTVRAIELGDGLRMELVLVPAGQFVMGDPRGLADERPLARVSIDKPFWMGRFEVTNEQYALFAPSHDSRHEHGTASFNSLRATGPLLNRPKQPVVRISWKDAMAYCDWLSERSELTVTLPTEAQWEYACRAGTTTPFSYGDLYCYHHGDDQNSLARWNSRVVRGGSWYDRPKRCRSSFRLDYPAWQKVYNVGFRVVCQVNNRKTSRQHGADFQ